jgi:hypothetical protein
MTSRVHPTTYDYATAFSGVSINPFTGRHCFHGTMGEYNHAPRRCRYPGNNHSCPTLGLVLEYSQQAQQKADTLLTVSRRIADRIDTMHKAGTTMLPRMDKILPLKWMPIFEGLKMDYLPPSCPQV